MNLNFKSFVSKKSSVIVSILLIVMTLSFVVCSYTANDDVFADMNVSPNMIVNFNQLFNYSLVKSGVNYGLTTTNINNSVKVSGTSNGVNTNFSLTTSGMPAVVGHKYFIDYKAISGSADLVVGNLTNWQLLSGSSINTVITAQQNQYYFGISLTNNLAVNVTLSVNFIDLTQMFGAGNEPSLAQINSLNMFSIFYPYIASNVLSYDVFMGITSDGDINSNTFTFTTLPFSFLFNDLNNVLYSTLSLSITNTYIQINDTGNSGYIADAYFNNSSYLANNSSSSLDTIKNKSYGLTHGYGIGPDDISMFAKDIGDQPLSTVFNLFTASDDISMTNSIWGSELLGEFNIFAFYRNNFISNISSVNYNTLRFLDSITNELILCNVITLLDTNENELYIVIPSINMGDSINTGVYLNIQSDPFLWNNKTVYFKDINLSDNYYYNLGKTEGISQATQDVTNQFNQSYSVGGSGYQAIYDDAYLKGNNQGYNKGFNAGVASASDYSFSSLISAVFDVPVRTIIALLDWDILGVNLKTLLLSLFSVAVVIFIVKIALGRS